MNHEDRDRLRAAFNRAYGTRFTRPGLRERVLGETAARQARRPGRHPHWALTAAAVALALLVTATLVVGGRVVRLGGSVPAHRGGPAPTASAAPSPTNPATPAPASPSPSPSATACRVPFIERTATGTTAHWLNADGTVTDEPSGTAGPYYDVARHRWLPVPRAAVSADGARYAYTSGGFVSSIHVVDVASGQDRAYAVTRAPWQVLDLAPDGLYLTQAWEGTAAGLWRLDPASGRLESVPGVSKAVTAVSDGIAWVQDLDSSVPALQSQLAGGPVPNRLSRLDLRTGAITPWLTVPNAMPSVIGYAQDGSPVVVTTGAQGYEVLLVTSSGQARTIASYPLDVSVVGWTAIADGPADWLSGPDGLYRYDGSTLRRVVATGHRTHPANRCI